MTTEKVTNVYWKTLPELLNPKGKKVQALKGFDDEFIDIVDYIIRITHRIWEQKDIGACYRYYGDYCPVHTLGGYSDDVETVVQNTLRTVAAFPDRTLLGENVVWRDLGDEGYYSSHRITSIMTNKGPSEFGSATGQTGRVTTIADCICRENKIVYEWLMRDNSFLIKQLGIDLIDAAEYSASFKADPNFTKWLSGEYQRVTLGHVTEHQWKPDVSNEHLSFCHSWLHNLFNQKSFSKISDYYGLNASVQWPGGRHAVGIPGIRGIFIQWLSQSPDAVATCDHVAVTKFDENTVDLAIRWSLAGTFVPNQSRLQKYSGQPFFILGATHLRVKNGLINSEWTVFDEVSALANIIRKYRQLHEVVNGGHQGA